MILSAVLFGIWMIGAVVISEYIHYSAVAEITLFEYFLVSFTWPFWLCGLILGLMVVVLGSDLVQVVTNISYKITKK